MAQVSTGNLPIPNDTGANVLADINENLLALQSNNSDTTPPVVAKANQFWIDTSTTPDTLKVRGNADNAAFITLGTIETNLGMMPKTGGIFTGAIRSPSGNEVTPAIQVGDSNTGLYLSSANVIGITCNGDITSSIHQDGITLNQGHGLYLNNTNESASVGLKCQSTLSSSWTLELPNDNGDAGEVLSTDGNGVTSWVAIQGVPTGSIFAFGGSENNIPSGYLECNGQSTSGHTALANLVGSTVPDLRARFIRGWDHGANRDPNRTRGSWQEARTKRHSHSAQYSVSTTGGNHGHAIRKISLQPSIANEAITLGSGQSYQIGYATNNNGDTNQAISTSGNLSLSSTMNLTINHDPVNAFTDEDDTRPQNIALIYIIKT